MSQVVVVVPAKVPQSPMRVVHGRQIPIRTFELAPDGVDGYLATRTYADKGRYHETILLASPTSQPGFCYQGH